MEKNIRISMNEKLVCPICKTLIEYTGEVDYDMGGTEYSECECKEHVWHVYEDKEENEYDLWLQ